MYRIFVEHCHECPFVACLLRDMQDICNHDSQRDVSPPLITPEHGVAAGCPMRQEGVHVMLRENS